MSMTPETTAAEAGVQNLTKSEGQCDLQPADSSTECVDHRIGDLCDASERRDQLLHQLESQVQGLASQLTAVTTKLEQQIGQNSRLESALAEALQVKDGFNGLVGVVQERFQVHADAMSQLTNSHESFAEAASEGIAQKDHKIDSLQREADTALDRILQQLAWPLHDRLYASAVAIEAGNEAAKAGLILALLEQLEVSLAECFDVHVIKPRPGEPYVREQMTAIEAIQAKRLWHRNETVAHTIRCGFHIGEDDNCRVLRKAEVAAYRR